MCTALWGTELNSGSVQVKYFFIYSMQQAKNVFSENSDCATSITAFDCNDIRRIFMNFILGDMKPAMHRKDEFNFICPKQRLLQ